MEQVKKEGNIPLVLDSGNLFFSQNPTPNDMKAQMRLKADLIAEAYKKIGIDALNVGEMDLAFGIKTISLKKRRPWVSRLFPPTWFTARERKTYFNLIY